MEKINWNEMGSYLEFPKGQPVRLILKDWRQQDQFKEKDSDKLKFGLTFRVVEEDNVVYDDTINKTWTCTAIKACKQLKPLIEKVEAAGKDRLCISVVVAGEGKNTVYTIVEVPEVTE